MIMRTSSNNKSDINGVLLIDKPIGITSFDVIRVLKKKLGQKKIGHCGTLDPLASGLLILCLGNATKIIPFLDNIDKEYVTKIKLGVETDTLDADGSVIATYNVEVTEEHVINAVNKFSGKIEQLPPEYSALKINGVRAYKLARQGKKVELKTREVFIKDIEVLDLDIPEVKIRVHCSKGTYIRSLARDIGKELKCGGHIIELNRTACGVFKNVDSIDLNLEKDEILRSMKSIDEILTFIPEIEIKEEYIQCVKHGKTLEQEYFINNPKEYGVYRITNKSKLIAVVSKDKTGLKYKRVFI